MYCVIVSNMLFRRLPVATPNHQHVHTEDVGLTRLTIKNCCVGALAGGRSGGGGGAAGSYPLHRQDRADRLPSGPGTRGRQVLVLQRGARARRCHVHDRDRGALHVLLEWNDLLYGRGTRWNWGGGMYPQITYVEVMDLYLDLSCFFNICFLSSREVLL